MVQALREFLTTGSHTYDTSISWSTVCPESGRTGLEDEVMVSDPGPYWGYAHVRKIPYESTFCIYCLTDHIVAWLLRR